MRKGSFVKLMLDAGGSDVLICLDMVCCLIGAFILGMLFRAARWTGRSIKKVTRTGRGPAEAPVRVAPVPVYEMPAYLTEAGERREDRSPAMV